MMNIFAETVVRKLLQLMLAGLFGVVAAVFVARAEPFKSGDRHEGERIVYLIPADNEARYRVAQQHGIIAAVADISTPLAWSEAQVICNSLSLRGFSDWSLPSKEDLEKLFLCKETLGGFKNGDYWSSSTPKPDSAWSKRFVDGKEDIRSWGNRLWVRPIRKF